MLKNFENETLFGRTKWPCFCFVFVYFTNFFLVLLIKKAFLRLLLCIFHNRQKKCRKPTRRYGQYTGSSIQTACEQHAQTSISAGKNRYSFSCQLLPALFLYRAQRLLAARLVPPGASRQAPHAAVLLFLQSKSQPSALQQPHFRQPLSTFTHSVLQPSNIPHPLSPLTFHQKKLSRRLSFSRCI